MIQKIKHYISVFRYVSFCKKHCMKFFGSTDHERSSWTEAKRRYSLKKVERVPRVLLHFDKCYVYAELGACAFFTRVAGENYALRGGFCYF